MLGLQVGGDLGLGSITVGQEFFLVVQELFPGLGGILDVRGLHVRVEVWREGKRVSEGCLRVRLLMTERWD